MHCLPSLLTPYDVFIDTVAQILMTRLEWIKEKPHSILVKGEDGGRIQKAFRAPQMGHGNEWIIDFMTLLWIHDVPGYLVQLKALKPRVFATVTIGGDTFWQLRQALAYADEKVYGDIPLRIVPMIHAKQMAMLLRRAGFQDVISDVEHFTLTYTCLETVFKDMRDCRLTRPLFRNPLLSKKVKQFAEDYLRIHFGDSFNLSIDLIFGIGF